MWAVSVPRGTLGALALKDLLGLSNRDDQAGISMELRSVRNSHFYSTLDRGCNKWKRDSRRYVAIYTDERVDTLNQFFIIAY